jgi:RNA polymerase primary sigma factor
MSLIKYESVEQKNDVLNIMRSYKYKHRVYGKDKSKDALDHSISLEPVEDFLSYNENNEFLEIDMMKESNSITINQVLETLSKRERIVLEMYFGINRDEPMSLNDIGEEFCLTRERIREIKIKAIQRLSHKSRSNYLRNN